MNNKIIAILITCIFLLTTINVTADEKETYSDCITLNYSFSNPVVETIDINGTLYNRIIMEDCPCCGNPGEPSLPCMGAYILLPQDTKTDDIIVTPGEMATLKLDHPVEPVAESVPLSMIEKTLLPQPDDDIYDSDEMFPGQYFTNIGTHSYRGYNILVLKLHLVQYKPETNEIFVYSDFKITVKTVETESNVLFRGLEKDRLEVIERCDNPSMACSYKAKSVRCLSSSILNTDEEYDMVIITSEELNSGFEPLKQYHDNNGLRTLIYTVEDIYDQYNGVDNAEKIRNFIRHAYKPIIEEGWGVEYVLLGGDSEIIPVRYLAAIDPLVNQIYSYCQIPSDFYYSTLEDLWNLPEKPVPYDKDLTDNEVDSITLEGNFNEFKLNHEEYKIGTYSYMLNCPDETSEYAYLNFTFEKPYNIKNKKWFNFYIKTNSDLDDYILDDILLHDNSCNKIRLYKEGYISIKNNWIFCTLDISTLSNFQLDNVNLISFVFKTRGEPSTEDNIILDGLFFSEYLDCYWGESGEEGDMYADVYVGRACVNNYKELDNFVNKTLSYAKVENNDSYLNNVLMAGEWLNINGDVDYGSIYLEELIGTCDNHGSKTIGFSPSKYKIKKLYDKLRLITTWTASEIIEEINKGLHIINHVGHSGYSYNMRIYRSDVDSLVNDKFCFIYSQGCMAGGFDNPEGNDCIAEYLTVKTPNGAFAGVWNSRYGWGEFDTTDAPSHRYHRDFWDAVFNENITVISKANQYSKDENLWRINEKNMRWVYYETNLFGDPSISFNMPEGKGKSKTEVQNKQVSTHRIIENIPWLQNLLRFVPLLSRFIDCWV
jgi:hypothetical protein